MQAPSTLKGKTISGLVWSFTEMLISQVIQLIIQIILARLLLPEHFGLIGMLIVFIALANTIVDSGLSQALIRDQYVSQDDYSTIFYFNIIVSLFMYGLLYIAAGPISVFFKEPSLLSILRVLSLVVIIDPFKMIQRVMLIKNVNFKAQTKINVIAAIIAGMIAIICAVMGYGVWSLVIHKLALHIIQLLMLVSVIKWYPSLVFSYPSFKKFFSFGSKLLISGVIDTIYRNLYFVIIGRVFLASQLGYFTNAMKLRDVASQSITISVSRVTYPVLSTMQDNEVALKHGFQKVVKMTAFISFPIMIGISSIASSLIYFLLGEKWLPAANYLQLLCLAGMLFPLYEIHLSILQVKGRSDLFLLLEVFTKSLLTIFLALAILFHVGIMGFIAIAVLHAYLSFFIYMNVSARQIAYSLKEQLQDLFPIFLVTSSMGIVVYALGTILPNQELIKIIIQIIVGILFYLGICKLFKIKELDVAIELIFSLLKAKRRAL